jgi:hypothetical protein
MGKFGGKQEGAGRPKGSINKKSQEILVRAASEGIMPVEVFLNDMRYFYKLGEDKMRIAEMTAPGKQQAKEFRGACELKDIARECARDAAPYVHPKLASLQANVNVNNVEAKLAELE